MIKPTTKQHDYPHPGPDYECFSNSSDWNGERNFHQSPEEAEEQHRRYLAKWKKGPPKETDHHSVERLREMGLFGLYRKKDGSDQSQ